MPPVVAKADMLAKLVPAVVLYLQVAFTFVVTERMAPLVFEG